MASLQASRRKRSPSKNENPDPNIALMFFGTTCVWLGAGLMDTSTLPPRSSTRWSEISRALPGPGSRPSLS